MGREWMVSVCRWQQAGTRCGQEIQLDRASKCPEWLIWVGRLMVTEHATRTTMKEVTITHSSAAIICSRLGYLSTVSMNALQLETALAGCMFSHPCKS